MINHDLAYQKYKRDDIPKYLNDIFPHRWDCNEVSDIKFLCLLQSCVSKLGHPRVEPTTQLSEDGCFMDRHPDGTWALWRGIIYFQDLTIATEMRLRFA